jgi:pimeloyl-ACP methyl ester carboxylesterase
MGLPMIFHVRFFPTQCVSCCLRTLILVIVCFGRIDGFCCSSSGGQVGSVQVSVQRQSTSSRTPPPLCLFSRTGDVKKEEEVNGSVQQRVQNVNFAAPLLDYGYAPTVEEYEDELLSEKPLLLYLPGFDGTYICPFIQFPELGTDFEVWCMTAGMNDRSTFEELKHNVLEFLEEITTPGTTTEQQLKKSQYTKIDQVANGAKGQKQKSAGPFWSNFFSGGGAARKKRRPIYLVGESFGGILASEVALTLLKEQHDFDLKGLVLINPATCYDRSQLAAKGPSVYNLPDLLYPFGLLSQLLPLFMDEFSFQQLLLILKALALPSVIDNPIREAYMGRVAFSLPTKLEYMPRGTLEWRSEQWLGAGCARMESRMGDFRKYPLFRTMIIAGEKDLTLPSIAEAERLVNLLPNSQVHVVEGAGHASTCGSRMDMAAILRARFSELQKPKPKDNKEGSGSSSKDNNNKSTATVVATKKRTTMKPEAAQGIGPYFGMEPRYDGADIGLNPVLYWSNENFRAIKKVDVEHLTRTKGGKRMYRKANYISKAKKKKP